MQSLDAAPQSPKLRTPISLNVDTGYNGKGKRRDASPPRTPPPRTQNSQMGRVNYSDGKGEMGVHTSPAEAWLDDITPVDPSTIKESEPRRRETRDSHDLSLSAQQGIRDSLVDHMLLSFDQFPYTQDEGRHPTVDEERLYSYDEGPYQPSSNFGPPRNGPSGHSYSYSSDYENDDSSRYSGQYSRGRRSNSSSNFQTGLGRINSGRNDNYTGTNPTISRGPQVQVPTRGLHSRGGKGSKGSSANSFDLGYAQVTSNTRWSRGLSGRSSSFDYGDGSVLQNAMSRQIDNNVSALSPLFSPYDYDAAPTPTIPGGPRRCPPSPIMLPHHEPAPVEPPPPKLERKRSTRSAKSAYKGKPISGGRPDYGLNNPTRDLPSLPAFIKEPAPAPSVAYGKTKEASQAAQPTKDRPGFFRRVFGSSKNNPAPTPDHAPSHRSGPSAETADQSSSKSHHIGNQIKPHYIPSPPREAPPAPKEHTHVLSKRPSAFFRRRKKSVSEPEAPLPVMPVLQYQPTADEPHSPASSLRQVMSPYLKVNSRGTVDSEDPPDRREPSPEDERQVRGFSPDYEPDVSATIRPVKSSSRDAIETRSPPYLLDQEAPAARTSGHHAGLDGHGQSRDERGATFLQDNSDNDPDAHSDSSKPALPTTDAATGSNRIAAPVSPQLQSASRDMMLGGQDERTLSKLSPASAKTDVSRDPSAMGSPRSVAESKFSQTKPASIVKEQELLSPINALESSRLWLELSSSEDDFRPKNLEPPTKTEILSTTSGSTDTVYKSATSLPILQFEGQDEDELHRQQTQAVTEALDADVSERAKMIYDGNEDFIPREKAAAWLGEERELNARMLTAYMELYDFTNLNILTALRTMCTRLVLKGESQQVDRILDAFAQRWCQCNPNHGFKVTDVVHTICYSLLLLNTDLHLADIEQKMTRSQFVKNTMPTIRKSVADSAPDAFEPNRPTVLPGKSQAFTQDSPTTKSNENLKPEKSSLEVERPSWRSSFKPPPRTDSDGLNGKSPTPLDYDTPLDDCGPLVKAPFHGTLRTWEVQVEIVLKDFYNSIRNERLPLCGATEDKSQWQPPSSSSLSVFGNGKLRRSPSVLSKTPSEPNYMRNRTADTVRVGGNKWASKNRSRPRLYPTSSGLGSSRTSLDDQSSMWSPSVSSSTWSKYSLGKTQTSSMSVDSFGSNWLQGDFQQSIGFANALSQAIIREETVGSVSSAGSDEFRVAPLLEDESLELAGAPWAKEGIVKHKHHLEALDKKAKDRNWNEVFAVIEKGYMSLFSFSTKSMRNKSKGRAVGGVVGGGNWQDNAENLGSFLLRQTIASALPSPGYSKARPHVWALSLPTGAVHLFQVGTPDIVKEFVSTANYWSARLSNHPLVGGISNIEYGWSDAVVNNVLAATINESVSSRPSTSARRPSIQSSLRSSIDQSGHPRSKLPGDRITISDWTPPTQSMRASNLMETDQLATLVAYVAGIEEELQKHNQLRNPMLLAFSPRHPNAQKAMANWEKKSSYLLREIVKFRTYIDSLQGAQAMRERVYAERAAEKAVAEGSEYDEADSVLQNE